MSEFKAISKGDVHDNVAHQSHAHEGHAYAGQAHAMLKMLCLNQ
ncbi:MAG: hypothetical protein RI519_02920 [Balneolaceae bacterium]|nr:hypothetical protein [Balneolaceae bacterium]